MLADRVLFLEAGSVAAFGRHDDLMRSHPRYAELFAGDRARARRSGVKV
jgi:ABC-type multidrug transport system fused ATPase/permease subunit